MLHVCAKAAYCSKREAKAALKSMPHWEGGWRNEARVYHCNSYDFGVVPCGAWHLTSQPHPQWDS